MYAGVGGTGVSGAGVGGCSILTSNDHHLLRSTSLPVHAGVIRSGEIHHQESLRTEGSGEEGNISVVDIGEVDVPQAEEPGAEDALPTREGGQATSEQPPSVPITSRLASFVTSIAKVLSSSS